MRNLFLCGLLAVVLPAAAAELTFNFHDTPVGQAPDGFRSTVAGQGKPGEWQVVSDDVPPMLAPLHSGAEAHTQQPVLAQTARQAIDSHYPMFVYDGDAFGDFKLTTRFKLAGGALEEMAGIVFRFQNESNYYVIRASGLGNNFRCYKVVDGVINQPIGPEVEVTKGAWHELALECEGNKIHGTLDGTNEIKLVDNTSANHRGKIGFWTKSDSVSYFTGATIDYVRREILAQSLVEREIDQYPRLLGLKVYARRSANADLAIVASKDNQEVGKPGGDLERDVISHGTTYYSRDKDKKTVAVTAPLRDRNGDPIAAVRVEMKSFLGETQDAALVRARPIIKAMEDAAPSLDDLVQ